MEKELIIKTAADRTAFRKTLHWQMFRKYILARRNFTCEFCGKQYKRAQDLNVHHLHDDNYDNLNEERFLVLCRTCHEFVHKKYNAPAFRSRQLAHRKG